MAQGSAFPLRKPPGFHWDFFLLGICTFIAGLIGVPAPNGLIPQAPIHTTSLTVMGPPLKWDKEEDQTATIETKKNENTRPSSIIHNPQPPVDPRSDFHKHEVPIAVVEQRVSNLAQGSLCLVLLTGPFLHLLNLIPRGALFLCFRQRGFFYAYYVRRFGWTLVCSIFYDWRNFLV